MCSVQDLEKRANIESLINQLYYSGVFETLVKIRLRTYFGCTNTNAIAPGLLSPAAFDLVQPVVERPYSCLYVIPL